MTTAAAAQTTINILRPMRTPKIARFAAILFDMIYCVIELCYNVWTTIMPFIYASAIFSQFTTFPPIVDLISFSLDLARWKIGLFDHLDKYALTRKYILDVVPALIGMFLVQHYYHHHSYSHSLYYSPEMQVGFFIVALRNKNDWINHVLKSAINLAKGVHDFGFVSIAAIFPQIEKYHATFSTDKGELISSVFGMVDICQGMMFPQQIAAARSMTTIPVAVALTATATTPIIPLFSSVPSAPTPLLVDDDGGVALGHMLMQMLDQLQPDITPSPPPPSPPEGNNSNNNNDHEE